MTTMVAYCQRAQHAVAKADDQIVNNGFIFIKQVRHHLIDNFSHHNRVKTAGITFIYACFNQFKTFLNNQATSLDVRITEF